MSVNIELVQSTQARNGLSDQWDALLADQGRCSIHVLLSGEGREIAGIIRYSFEEKI